MRRRLHRGSIAAAVAAIAAMIVACGKPARDDARVEKVVWMMPLDQKMKPTIDGIVQEFERDNPAVDVEMLWVPSQQYQTKFKTLVAAGLTPDLFYCGDVWVAYLKPFLLDITPYVERDREELQLDDFYPELLEACQVDGRYLYLPRYFNVSLLYYNVGMFRDAGMALPTAEWTWDDYTASSLAMQAKLGHENGLWASDIVTGWWGEWLIFVRQSGGDFFDETGTRSGLDSPEAIRGLKQYYDKVYTHRIAPRPGFRPEKGFAAGVFALSQGGHSGDWYWYRQVKGLEWDVQLLPSGPNGRAGGEVAVDAIGIAGNARHPEAAWGLMKRVVSVDGIRRHAELGFPPVRRSVAEETILKGEPGKRAQSPQNAEALYAALDHALPIPRHPDFIEIAIQLVQPEIDMMLEGKQTPEEAARRAAQATNRFLDTVATRPQEAAP
jgi:multiple sugar transport system substrate-binding protein